MDWTNIPRLVRLFVVLGFAPSLACGDDEGTTGTGDDSSTSADDDDDDGPSTMTDPTTPTEESSSGDTAPTTSSDGGSSSSDGSTGSSGADTSGSGDDSSGSSEDSTTSAVCEPPTEDGSAIGQDCMGAPCPDGYTCQDINAFQFQQLCAILCEEDCECPEGHTCGMHQDNINVWFECDPP